MKLLMFFISLLFFSCNKQLLPKPGKLLIKKGTIIYCSTDKKPFLEVVENIHRYMPIKASHFKSLRKWKNWELKAGNRTSPKKCKAWLLQGLIIKGFWGKNGSVKFEDIK